MLSLDYYSQLYGFFIVLSRQPVMYHIHLLLRFVFISCFLFKEPALMGSYPFWFPSIWKNLKFY